MGVDSEWVMQMKNNKKKWERTGNKQASGIKFTTESRQDGEKVGKQMLEKKTQKLFCQLTCTHFQYFSYQKKSQ